MQVNKKRYTGIVSSDKMDKTIVVTVTTRKLHPAVQEVCE